MVLQAVVSLNETFSAESQIEALQCAQNAVVGNGGSYGPNVDMVASLRWLGSAVSSTESLKNPGVPIKQKHTTLQICRGGRNLLRNV